MNDLSQIKSKIKANGFAPHHMDNTCKTHCMYIKVDTYLCQNHNSFEEILHPKELCRMLGINRMSDFYLTCFIISKHSPLTIYREHNST